MRSSRTIGIAFFTLGLLGFIADLGGVAAGLQTLYGFFNIPLTYDTFVAGLIAVGIALVAVSLRFPRDRPDSVRAAELRWCVDEVLLREMRSLMWRLESKVRSHNWDPSSEAWRLYRLQHQVFDEAISWHKSQLEGPVDGAELDSRLGSAYWTCIQLRSVAAVADRHSSYDHREASLTDEAVKRVMSQSAFESITARERALAEAGSKGI